MSGLAALLLWPAHASAPELLRLPYIAVLGVSAFCGFSILFITARDAARGPKRGGKIRALRGFDIAFALLLVVPSVLALRTLF